MMSRSLAAACTAIWLVAPGVAARAQAPIVPSWIVSDAAGKSAVIDLYAGWNSNNGTLNFNGYAHGEVRIVVPVGWRVTVKLFNPDLTLAHSAIVTKPYEQGKIPTDAPAREAAIPRAYTSSPERGFFNNRDEFDFMASESRIGDYYLFCGVSTHGIAGMWLHLSIHKNAESPHLLIEKPPAKPGRP